MFVAKLEKLFIDYLKEHGYPEENISVESKISD